MSGGPTAVADYELLELLLFRAIPRRDVKPLAKRLMQRFGDLAGVLAAAPERLREIDGLGEAAVTELKIVQAAGRAVSRAALTQRDIMCSGDHVVAYLRATLGRRPVEEVWALFLDAKNQLICDESLGQGAVDRVALFPSAVMRRALAVGAAGVIIAHNHPSGDPSPSRADRELTKKLVAAGETVDVRLIDHFIVGSTAVVSFRARNLL